MFCDYSKLVTLHKEGDVHFRLLGTIGFHARTKNKRFTSEGSRCRQKFKHENSTASFGRLRQFFYQKACRTCSTIIFPHSLICCCCRRHFLNSLMLYNAHDFVPKIVLSIPALDSEPVTETGSRVISSCNLVAGEEENPWTGVVPVAYQRLCV